MATDLTPTFLTLGGVFVGFVITSVGWFVNARIEHGRIKLKEQAEYYKRRSNTLSDLMGKVWAIATAGEEANLDRSGFRDQSDPRVIADIAPDQRESYMSQVRGLQARFVASRHNLLVLMADVVGSAERFGEVDVQVSSGNTHLADYVRAWCKLVLKASDDVNTEVSVIYDYADALIGDLRALRAFEEAQHQAVLAKSEPQPFKAIADPKKLFSFNSPRMLAAMAPSQSEAATLRVWEPVKSQSS